MDLLSGLASTTLTFRCQASRNRHGSIVGLGLHHSDISVSAVTELPRIYCRGWVSQISGSTKRNTEPPFAVRRHGTAVDLLSGLASTTLTFRCQASRNRHGSIVGLGLHHSDISVSAVAESPRTYCRGWVSQISCSMKRVTEPPRYQGIHSLIYFLSSP